MNVATALPNRRGVYVVSPSAAPKFVSQISHISRTLGDIYSGRRLNWFSTKVWIL